MGAAQQTVAKDQIRKLVPFNGLSDAHFEEVIKKIIIKQLPSGKVLFKKGERDNQTCYVLAGEVNLLVGRSVKQKLLGDSEEALHPLAPQQPRQFTAKSKTPVTILHIDSGLLDVMLTWDQSGEIEVNEIDTDSEINDDWMARMLQSELLMRLPALNIQQLIMRMESVEVTAGTTIVNQDDEGDYYYIIKKGGCVVTRKPSSNARAVKLAELHSGDSFGEESLLSGGKRNASITMTSDGEIMRLSKKDFDELLKEPLVNQVDYKQAKERINEGDRWLDVRLPGEFENGHMPDSIAIPLAALRVEADSLDPGINYIVYCDTGRRSASASFLLGHYGINSLVLKDGIGSVPHEDLVAGEKVEVAPGSDAGQGDDGSAEIIDFNKQRQQTEQEPTVLQDVDDAELNDREQALLQKEQNLQRIEAELVGKKAELDALEEHLDAKQEQQNQPSDELKAELERLTQRINGKSEELTAATKEKEELSTNLARQEEMYAAQIIELETAHQGIEKESVHLRDELEMLRSERTDGQERLASLQNQLDTVKQELDTARASGESTKNALQSEYEKLAEELVSSRGNEQKLQDELSAYQQQKKELVRELEDIRTKSDSSLNETRHQYDELQQDKEQLQSKLQQEQQQLSELREQLKQAQDQQSSITAEQQHAETEHKAVLETVNQELTVLGEQAGKLHQELESLNTEKQKLAQELDDANSRNARTDEQLEKLRIDLVVSTERQTSLQNEIEALRSDKDKHLESQKSEFADLQQALRVSQEELESVKASSQQELATQKTSLAQEADQLQQTISNLEQEKDTLKHELDKTVQHSEAVLATVTAEKDLVTAQSVELQQRLSGMESDLHAQLQKYENQTQELDTSKQSLQTLKSDLENEKRSQDQLRTELLQVQARLSEAELQHNQALGQSRQELEEARSALEARLSDTEASHQRKLSSLQDDFDGATAELKTLESKFRAMRSERDSAIDLRAAVEQELETLRKRYDSVRNEVGSIQTDKKDTSEIERERDALTKDKLALETELTNLREQLNASGEADLKQLADMESEINHLKRDVERLADEKKYAEQERESAATALKEVQTKAEDSVANQEQMERTLAEINSARETLENRYTELEQEHDGLKQRYSDKESELKSAEISMQDTKTQAERYEQQLATLEARRDEMSVQLGGLQAQRDELSQQLIREQSNGQSSSRELQDQLANLQTEYQNLQKQIEQNKHERNDHERAMQAQESANLDLEQKLAEQENQLRSLQQEMSKLSGQSDEQIQQLQELDKELEAKRNQLGKLQTSQVDTDMLEQNTEMLQQNIDSLEAVNSKTQSQLEALQQSAVKSESRVAELESELFMARQQLEQQSGYKADLEQLKRDMRHKPGGSAAGNSVQGKIENIYQQEQINTATRPDAIRPAEIHPAEPQSISAAGAAPVSPAQQLGGGDAFGLADVDDAMLIGKPPRSGKLLSLLLLGIVALAAGGGAYWWFVIQPGQQPQPLAEAPRQLVEQDSGKLVVKQKQKPAVVASDKTGSAGNTNAGDNRKQAKADVKASPAKQEVRKDPESLRKKPAVKKAETTAKDKKQGVLKARRTYRDFLQGGGAGPVMVELPSGKFMMGSGENSTSFDERPQRLVKIASHSISKYEVMFEDYDRFASATGRKQPDDNGWARGRMPVINVAWDDAVAYTQWLSEQTGHTYRLPTEAEWEYAARAGTSTPYHWGVSKGKNNANCFDCGSKWDGRETAPVGKFKPNSLGLYDMAGNVPEWVQDCYVNNYKKAPAQGTAVQTASCERRVVRGGSYRSTADNIRSAKREAYSPDTRVDIGFRVVRVR